MDAQRKRINQAIGRRLRIARAWRDLSVEALAKELRVTTAKLEKYEDGQPPISCDTLVEISRCLDLPVIYFFAALFPADSDEGMPPRRE